MVDLHCEELGGCDEAYKHDLFSGIEGGTCDEYDQNVQEQPGNM